MLGFLFGTACLLGLIHVVKGSCTGTSWRRPLLRKLFQRLDTTHGQEKVLFAAIEAVEQAYLKGRDQVMASRAVAADSIRGEHFNGAAVREAFSKNSSAVEELHKAIVDSLQSVHEALRPEQRRELADLLAFGPGRGRCGRHGRHGCGPQERWASGFGGGAVHL